MLKGVRFACQPGCTNCCRRRGYVYLTEEDIGRAALYLGMSAPEFEGKYVYRTRHLRRLRKPRHAECQFLLEGGCSIHPAKPTQCRLFPFWPEFVATADTWNELRELCPGIGQGPLIRIQAARQIASEMVTAYPETYVR